MGKPDAPTPDPRIGNAANKSAQLGQDYLAFMKEQAGVTNQWAEDDRARYQTVFQPLEDKYIADAAAYASPDRMAGRVNEAQAGVQTQVDAATGGMNRNLMAMGVDPNSGRFDSAGRAAGIQGALAVAGAGNAARGDVRQEAQAMQANAINMGKGLAVNPATSMGLSNGAAGAGFNGAMSGYGQQGSLLNAQFGNQMDVYGAQSAASGSLWGGLGSIAGLAFGGPAGAAMLSDKDAKEKKTKPGRSLLEAVEKMPVEEWSYKEGEGDGGRHVGTYAQDFKKQTGIGDGQSINVIDAIGTTMGAVKELSAEVKSIKSMMRTLPQMAEAT